MAQEFYLHLDATGKAAPFAGKVTQIVAAIDAGAVFNLLLDGTSVYTLSASGTNDGSFVIPVMIPVKAGQLLKTTGANVTVTVA